MKTGEELADRARLSADAEGAGRGRVGRRRCTRGSRARGPRRSCKKSRLPEKLAAARAAVRKERIRRDRLAAMDAALKAGSSSGVYAARDALVAEYADQAEDRELLARMTAANDLIRKAVTVDPSGRPGETEPHPDPLGPPTTLVLRGSGSGRRRPRPTARSSSPWPTGRPTASTARPARRSGRCRSASRRRSRRSRSPGGPAVLAVDARHEELVRLDLRTGALVWRQSLGGPVVDPPLVLGNQVIQATPAGKVLVIDLPTGALRATVDLGMPLARTPVGDESGQVLYVVAEKDCLFVLTRDPLGCEAVEYLGHAPGSVALPAGAGGPLPRRGREPPDQRGPLAGLPARRGRGRGSSAVQQVPVVGWTWGTPASSGSVIWASADRGGVAAYARRRVRREGPVPPDRPDQRRRRRRPARPSPWRGRSASSGRLGPVGPLRAGPRAGHARRVVDPRRGRPRAGPAADGRRRRWS